jgi:molybdenum cofactor biosynthesis enzyme
MNEPTTTSEEQELRRDIAETREELGETVEALVQKTDEMKGQAKAKARTAATVAAGALVVVVAIGWLLRRR